MSRGKDEGRRRGEEDRGGSGRRRKAAGLERVKYETCREREELPDLAIECGPDRADCLRSCGT